MTDGTEARLPLTAAVEEPLKDLSVEQLADISGIASSANMSYAIQQRFHKIWELVRENSETAKACMKEAVDKSLNTSEADFQKGDLVILKASANPPGPNQKLTQHRGPAVILEVKFPNLIIRIKENNVVVDKTVNVSQVRKYHGKLKDEELVDTRCFVCNRYHIQSRGRKRVSWIKCETCFKWYHQQCVVIPDTLNLTTDSWHCDKCKSTAQIRQINIGQPKTLSIATWNINGIRSWITKNGLDYLTKYHSRSQVLC